MTIDEIIVAYEIASETKKQAEKDEKLYKGMLLEYIKTNGIMNPETAIKEKASFETDEHSVIIDKTVQIRFDQKSFFADFPTAKDDYPLNVPVVKIISSEKPQQKTA